MTNNDITYQPATLAANFARLREDVLGIVAPYANTDYSLATEDDESGIRKVRADLNARKKDLDERRKAIKREYNKPLEAFEAEVKSIMAIYDDAMHDMDDALDNIASARQEKRIAALKEAYEDAAPILVPLVPVSTFIANDSKLLQKATSEKAAINRLLDMVEELAKNQAILEKMQIDHKQDAEAHLFDTLDLQAAIEYAERLTAMDREREEAIARVESMKQEQRELGGELPEVSLSAYITEPETYDVSMTFRSITKQQLDGIVAYCKANNIHGNIRRD